MKNTLLYALAAGAFIAASTSFAANVSVGGSTSSGMTWDNVAWDPAAPTDGDNVTIGFTDADNSLLMDSSGSIGRLTLNSYSKMLISGASASLTTTADDILVNDYSRLEITNGANVTLASGKSFQVKQNASMLVDASTITGQFYGSAYNVVIQNGSTWRASGTGITYNGHVIVKDSTVELIGDYKMAAGTRGELTLDNSSMGGSSSTYRGINFGGTTNIINGSSVQYVNHFNVGRESGSASGDTTVTVRGTALKNSIVSAQNAWLNVNNGGTSQLVLDGYADVDFTTKMDLNKSNGGNFYITFQNSNNSLDVGSTAFAFGSKSDGTSFQAASGEWKISAVSGSTNNTLTSASDISLQTSTLDGHAVNVGIDWGGDATNVFTVTNKSLYLNGSTAANSTGNMYVTVRDGAKMNIGSELHIGSKDGTHQSGTNIVTLKDGTKNLDSSANSDLYVSGNLYINSNKANTTSTAVSKLVIDNSEFKKSSYAIYVGNNTGLSGTSSFELINGSKVDLTVGLYLNMSNDATSNATSSFLIDSSTFTTSGEIYLQHGNANPTGDANVRGGNVKMEVTGTGALFESLKKGLYSGYNTNVSGGSVEMLLSGSNNAMKWGTDAASENQSFHMNAASGYVQTGGTFDVKITGQGNVFEANNILIGRDTMTGGANRMSVVGSSSVASEKNVVRLVRSGTLSIKSTQSDSAENSFTMGGNAVLTRLEKADSAYTGAAGDVLPAMTEANSVTVELGTSATAAGLSKFSVTGANNEIRGWNLTIGNAASSGTNKAVFRVEGSTHSITFGGTLNFRGSGTSIADAAGGRFEFVLADGGAGSANALINVNSIGDFSGLVDIDFSKLLGQYDGTDADKFLLISSGGNWETAFNAWYDDNKGLINYKFRDSENDTAELKYENGSLYLYYTSAVPEPSTYAAILGAVALACAAYRKRKQGI